MAQKKDAAKAADDVENPPILAPALAGLALIACVIAIGAAFIPPSNTEVRGTCPVPALFDRPGYIHSLESAKDPRQQYDSRGATDIADSCGVKVDHHIRMSVGAMTLAVPLGLLALFVYFRRRLQP